MQPASEHHIHDILVLSDLLMEIGSVPLIGDFLNASL